jgi:TonB family protein
VAVKQLDPSLIAPTRSFKMQAFPPALLAMTSVFIAALLGAASASYGASPVYHHALAWLAVAINALVAIAEYRAIARNGRLIDVAVARSSGFPVLDQGVVAGVRAGSPYAPLPPEIHGDRATFTLPLVSMRSQ